MKYISLINWTDQGIKNVKDSAKRLDAGRKLAKKFGCTVGDAYLTIGPYDMVVMIEAPDDETATAMMLQVSALGNVHTHTARAFTAAEMDKILAKKGS